MTTRLCLFTKASRQPKYVSCCASSTGLLSMNRLYPQTAAAVHVFESLTNKLHCRRCARDERTVKLTGGNALQRKFGKKASVRKGRSPSRRAATGSPMMARSSSRRLDAWEGARRFQHRYASAIVMPWTAEAPSRRHWHVGKESHRQCHTGTRCMRPPLSWSSHGRTPPTSLACRSS